MTDDLPVETLRNLGPVSCRWLNDAGITTIGKLKQLGPVPAFIMVRQRQPKASLNLLWGLASALQGIDWRELTEETKSQLRRQLNDLDR